jgi:hypothetical protein
VFAKGAKIRFLHGIEAILDEIKAVFLALFLSIFEKVLKASDLCD